MRFSALQTLPLYCACALNAPLAREWSCACVVSLPRFLPVGSCFKSARFPLRMRTSFFFFFSPLAWLGMDAVCKFNFAPGKRAAGKMGARKLLAGNQDRCNQGSLHTGPRTFAAAAVVLCRPGFLCSGLACSFLACRFGSLLTQSTRPGGNQIAKACREEEEINRSIFFFLKNKVSPTSAFPSGPPGLLGPEISFIYAFVYFCIYAFLLPRPWISVIFFFLQIFPSAPLDSFLCSFFLPLYCFGFAHVEGERN